MLAPLKKLIKLKIAMPDYFEVIRAINNGDGQNKRAVLIGSPVHANLGDHMIAKQAVNLIKTLPFDEIIEVPEYLYELFYREIRIKPADTVFLSGGGWMGDIYKEDEAVVESVLERFRGNRIIVLPQTVFFSNTCNSKKLKKLLDDSEDIIISVRERSSYDMLVKTLQIQERKCLMLPDLALTCPVSIRKGNNALKSQISVGIALRNDVEAAREYVGPILQHYLLSLGINFSEFSTIYKKKFVRLSERDRVLKEKISELEQYGTIITDRLHAMIFSYIAGVKCIALDNSTHKVKNVYDAYLKDDPNILFTYDIESLLTGNVLEAFLKRDYVRYEGNFAQQYGVLKSIFDG